MLCPGAAHPESTQNMKQMKLGSAGEDVRLMPWTTQQVRNRMAALALAIGAEIDPEASERHRSLAGTIVMPFARLLIFEAGF
ncbi:hypothetical protein SAMN06295987_11225 [Novosphingobium mathurense]|uniref:Uncharacterized protein n=2 Tax=Novosphingobium mathurense TaxID=428990 RepID=A0A1U6IRJ2_9SPHN|nr:hypothetical protein SAMN06295987_11225 [Novosphingobium mathurense]